MLFRQSLLNYAERNGASRAARKYKTNRQYVYRWRKRYDGTLESLREKSRRPHGHPGAHTDEEAALIKTVRAENPDDGLVIFWVKLWRAGYERSIAGLYRFLRRCEPGRAAKKRKPKYVPKPYEAMTKPGERMQIDVKFVPKSCVTDPLCADNGLFQYTAIDEYSRWRYVEGFDERNTDASARFAKNLARAFPFKIECVQTDNGPEFTNRFVSDKDKPTRFELALADLGIRHKLIRPYTPRHNGKVERSHRKDNERFYSKNKFASLEDFKAKLFKYNKEDYNDFPTRPLGWRTPRQALSEYLRARCNT
jgi:transposase InsO family protein